MALPALFWNAAGLFTAGAFGALIVVYLSRDTVIPAFRSYLDASDVTKLHDEQAMYERLAEEARVERDRTQDRIERGELSGEAATKLLDSRDREFDRLLAEARDRRTLLMQNQKGTTLAGFVVYVVVGGVFGVLLASVVTTPVLAVDGFVVNDGLEALAVGAAWPSYFAALRLNQRTPQIAQSNLETAEALRTRVEDLKYQLTGLQMDVLPTRAPGATSVPVQDARTKAAFDDLTFAMDRTGQEFDERLRAQRIVMQTALPKR